jgi:hypothetical protein
MSASAAINLRQHATNIPHHGKLLVFDPRLASPHHDDGRKFVS